MYMYRQNILDKLGFLYVVYLFPGRLDHRRRGLRTFHVGRHALISLWLEYFPDIKQSGAYVHSANALIWCWHFMLSITDNHNIWRPDGIRTLVLNYVYLFFKLSLQSSERRHWVWALTSDVEPILYFLPCCPPPVYWCRLDRWSSARASRSVWGIDTPTALHHAFLCLHRTTPEEFHGSHQRLFCQYV